mgnify:FL=1
MIKSFVMGAITGGVAVWLWGDRLRDYLAEQTDELRTKAADQLEAVQETASDALESARIQLEAKMRAGQEAIRPPEVRGA